jgi:CheY-like chemotaxis protein
MASILVVDDEAEIRDLIERVLVREGYQVEAAVNGAAALKAVEDHCYDLVICNVRMPVMDGPTFFGRVQECNPAQASRFVFCTGDIVSPDARSFLLGIDQPVLTKPFGLANLRETVRRFLGELPRVPFPARQLEEHGTSPTLHA